MATASYQFHFLVGLTAHHLVGLTDNDLIILINQYRYAIQASTNAQAFNAFTGI